MNKFVAGKASIVTLLATVVVSTFLLGKSFTSVAAVDSRAYCHATSSSVNPYNYLFNPAWVKHLENNGTPLSGHELDFFTEVGDRNCDHQVDPSPTPGAVLGCTDEKANNFDPEATVNDGSCEYDEEGTPTPESTPTDDGDICDNIDGIQTGVPEGLHLDASGRNCVAFSNSNPPENNSTPQGQVLGAKAMASTGSFAETLYQVVMGLGGLLTVKGVKNFKKASKRS